jgi:hypothetical protein
MVSIRPFIIVTAIFGLLCFPLFYFVYKFGTPYLGMIDFFDYYKLFETMDFMRADSPLNMRLVASGMVHLMSKAGFFYDTACAIDAYPVSKVIYFNVLFFNFVCVVFTCGTLFVLLRKRGIPILLSFVGGLLYLLGFGTIFFQLMPLVDAFTTLCFTVILIFYYRKSYWAFPVLALMILQREYLLMAFGLAALIDYLYTRDRYQLRVFLFTGLCFFTYVVLRKTIFETARYAHHTDPSFMYHALTGPSFPIIPFLKQTAMTLNIFFIYLAVVIYKKTKRLGFDKTAVIKIVALFLQVVVLAFILALGNNTGRYFYIITPLIIVALIKEISPLLTENSK